MLSPTFKDKVSENTPSLDSTVENRENGHTSKEFNVRVLEFDKLMDNVDDDFIDELHRPKDLPIRGLDRLKSTIAQNAEKEGIDLEGVDLHWESIKWDEGTYINCNLKYFDLSQLGYFDVIVVDPPWSEADSDEPTYNTMSDEEILNIDVNCLSEKGFCYLWCTNENMEFALHCLKSWGYHYIDRIVWIKKSMDTSIVLNKGNYLMRSTETCLVGIKRSGRDNVDYIPKVSNDLIFSNVKKRFQKPLQLYGIIEKMMPGARKIELFGRNHNIRKGWLTLGNQLGKKFDWVNDLVNCDLCGQVIPLGKKRYKHKYISNRDICQKCIERTGEEHNHFVLNNEIDELCLHEFYECVVCKVSPLWGIRFSCDTCRSFHTCEECYDKRIVPSEYQRLHEPDHQFVCHEVPESDTSMAHPIKCIGCNAYPIVGNAVRCQECPSLLVCQRCFFEKKLHENHRTHPLEIISKG